ncbi:MAG: DUF6569 family protein, partial [Planctomycetales bacterium]
KSRLAVQDKADQGEVWTEVAGARATFTTTLSLVVGQTQDSGAFTGIYADETIQKQLAECAKALEQSVASRDRVIGVVVAVNGKPEAVDVFGSTPLFRKLWPKLLRGYALDATAARDAETANAECAAADARKFLDDALAGEVTREQDVAGGLTVTRRNADGVVSFGAFEDGAASPAMGGLGGLGGAIHFSGFAN